MGRDGTCLRVVAFCGWETCIVEKLVFLVLIGPGSTIPTHLLVGDTTLAYMTLVEGKPTHIWVFCLMTTTKLTKT